MWFIDNINGINIKEIEKEKINGIYSNTFPLFSQNDLVCRYGLFAQRGRINLKKFLHFHLLSDEKVVSRRNNFFYFHFI